jgi:hypothetical protein
MSMVGRRWIRFLSKPCGECIKSGTLEWSIGVCDIRIGSEKT